MLLLMHTIAKFEVFVAFNPVNLSVALCASSNFYREIQIRHFCPPFCCRLGALCRALTYWPAWPPRSKPAPSRVSSVPPCRDPTEGVTASINARAPSQVETDNATTSQRALFHIGQSVHRLVKNARKSREVERVCCFLLLVSFFLLPVFVQENEAQETNFNDYAQA